MRVDRDLPAKILKRVGQVRRLGIRGLARTAYIGALGPAAYALTNPVRHLGAALHRRKVANRSPASIDMLKERVEREVRLDAAPLLRELDPDADARLASNRIADKEMAIGEIGADGAVLSRLGPVRGVRCVSEDEFHARPGAAIVLVDLDGRLGVRKSFGSKRNRFTQVLKATLDLTQAGCAVPPVISVDWDANAITSAFVAGTPFSQSPASPATRQELDELLPAIHRAGYVLDVIDEDDLVLAGSDRMPVWVDLQNALPLAGLSRDMSIHLRDRDRRKFNARFGTHLITAAELRSRTSPVRLDDATDQNARADRVYASIVIRDDIRWGKIWNTDVGIARWNYILNDHLPIPHGGRVLDLGSNNGFNPLQMLRSGAASAVGVEINEQAIGRGEYLKRAYEWLDNRLYDFRYVHGSHADLSTYGLGRFDLVTALCSLYYVDDERARATVRYIRGLSNLLVLQCNTDRLIHRQSAETFRMASVEYALEVLKQGGFGECQVIAPPGYSRPLVIGRATAGE